MKINANIIQICMIYDLFDHIALLLLNLAQL